MNVETSQSVTVRRRIKAYRDRVFDAFQREDAIAQWFKPDADTSIEVLGFSFEKGGDFHIRYEMADGTVLRVKGTFLDISRPEKIAFSWIWQEPDVHAGIETEVVVCFLARDDSTEIALTHMRLPSQGYADRHNIGWARLLCELQSYLQPGNPEKGN